MCMWCIVSLMKYRVREVVGVYEGLMYVSLMYTYSLLNYMFRSADWYKLNEETKYKSFFDGLGDGFHLLINRATTAGQKIRNCPTNANILMYLI